MDWFDKRVDCELGRADIKIIGFESDLRLLIKLEKSYYKKAIDKISARGLRLCTK